MGEFPDGNRNINDHLSAIMEQGPERRCHRDPILIAKPGYYLFTAPFRKQITMKTLLIGLLAAFALNACGQIQGTNDNQKTKKTEQKMDLAKISNENVRKAIEALQTGNKAAWYSCFTDEVIFTDDGRSLNFTSFFDNAFDKNEKFLDLDQIEHDGKDIYGNFHAGQWGTFRVFFKFHQNGNGKFDRLDIGQAPK